MRASSPAQRQARRLRYTRAELEIVGSIAEALNSSPSVQEALERTLELVTDLLGLQTGWVWLVDPETRAGCTALLFQQRSWYTRPSPLAPARTVAL